MPSFEWGNTFGVCYYWNNISNYVLENKESAQIRIVSEFSRNLHEAENKIAEISDMPHDESLKAIRYKQYLN
jgi:hypothetical protein